MRRKSVSFGEKSEELLYDNRLSETEKSASFYSSEQFQAMRGQAYGLAKTAVLLGNNDVERLYRGQDTLRGLEKQLATNQALTVKRKHNIIRSIVELHQLEKCDHELCSSPDLSESEEQQPESPRQHYQSLDKERAHQIKVVLEKYVQKHRNRALKAARERALGDEKEARTVYGDLAGSSSLGAALKMGVMPRRRTVA